MSDLISYAKEFGPTGLSILTLSCVVVLIVFSIRQMMAYLFSNDLAEDGKPKGHIVRMQRHIEAYESKQESFMDLLSKRTAETENRFNVLINEHVKDNHTTKKSLEDVGKLLREIRTVMVDIVKLVRKLPDCDILMSFLSLIELELDLLVLNGADEPNLSELSTLKARAQERLASLQDELERLKECLILSR